MAITSPSTPGWETCSLDRSVSTINDHQREDRRQTGMKDTVHRSSWLAGLEESECLGPHTLGICSRSIDAYCLARCIQVDGTTLAPTETVQPTQGRLQASLSVRHLVCSCPSLHPVILCYAVAEQFSGMTWRLAMRCIVRCLDAW